MTGKPKNCNWQTVEKDACTIIFVSEFDYAWEEDDGATKRPLGVTEGGAEVDAVFDRYGRLIGLDVKHDQLPCKKEGPEDASPEQPPTEETEG